MNIRPLTQPDRTSRATRWLPARAFMFRTLARAGFLGGVTAVHPGALTVTRDDNGWRELVLLSRRRVMAVDQ
jgi:hypothetical protein